MRYYVKTVYRYGRASVVENALIRFAEGKKQHVLSEEAVDGFVEELKEEQRRLLQKRPKLSPATVSMEKTVSQKTGLPCVKIYIGYHVVYLESIQGEEV